MPNAERVLEYVLRGVLAEMGQLLPRLRVVVADGRPRRIAAGHYQTVWHVDAVVVVKKQTLHRRVGQHDADGGLTRRDTLAQAAARFFLEQQNRLLMSR